MLRRNFASTTNDIGATDFYKMAMDFHDRQKQKELDVNELMGQYQKGVDLQKRNALADALQSGDEDAINKAASAYNPEGQLDYIQRIKQAREAEDRQFARQKELADYRHQLSVDLQNIRNKHALDLKQMEYQGLGNIEGFTPTGNPAYDKEVITELAKNNIEKIKSARQLDEMRPSLEGALSRADRALLSGKGIGLNSVKGIFGEDSLLGQMFSSEEANANRADIETANSQMNAYLRAKLAATGLTGGELNSEVEARAYRYTINPNDSKETIKRKIKNFRDDYLGGSAPKMDAVDPTANPEGWIQRKNFEIRARG